MFDSPGKLVLGSITGLTFGFLLLKGRVAKYHVILSQFLLKDWTVVKIMATAVHGSGSAVWYWREFYCGCSWVGDMKALASSREL